jgi:hypothetical protein
MTGRLNGAQLVMEFINRVQADKEKKKQAQWDIEDRELKKKLTEAQISNYYETSPSRQPAQKGYKVPPQTLKEVANYFKFPESEWGQYDPEMQKDMVAKYLTIKGQKPNAVKPPTPKGVEQAKKLKIAMDLVAKRKAPYVAGLSQLYGNPDKEALFPERTSYLQRQVDLIDEQAGAIALMLATLEDKGELSDEDAKKLDSILRFRSMYRPPQKKKEEKKTEAESKLPPGFQIIR